MNAPYPRRWTLALCLALAVLPASAGVDVKIEGLSAPLEANVRAFLSLQRYATTQDLDAEMMERLGDRADREVRAALKPFGHYEPVIVTQIEAAKGGWTAVLRVTPGPVVQLVAADVTVTGPGRDDRAFRQALAASPLKAGGPLRHADYEAIKGELQRAAVARGYLDATFTRAELAVDVDRHEARATLELATGERYRFGATSIEQHVIDPEVVRKFLRWREGDWYEAAMLLRTQFALDDSEYFGLVEVLPGTRDPAARTVPISIRARPGKRNKYSIAVGYATDTRFGAKLGWKNRRLNEHGHRLGAEIEGSQIKQAATLSYVLPWTDPALEKLSFDLTAGHELFGDLETSGGSLRAGLTQVRGNWQRVMFATASLQTSDTGQLGEDGQPVDDGTITDQLVVPGISYASMPTTISGSTYVGHGFLGELLGSHSALGSQSDFLRLRVRSERRFRLALAWHLIARGEIGASAVSGFSELPAEYRFFAGGDRSVRGYQLDELSPVNEAGDKIGGRHLLVGSLEIERDLPRNFAIAVFVDAGNAFNRFGDPLEYSAGIGVRFKLPFISMGIDVAQSVSDSSRGPRLHLNISPVL